MTNPKPDQPFMKQFYIIAFLLFISYVARTQTSALQENYKLHIKKTSSPIKIDGVLDEAAWGEAETSTDFIRKYPDDKAAPIRRTVVKLSYSKDYLYLAFIAYDTNYHVVQSLKRDGGHERSDAVGVFLDPLNQRSGGFIFTVNAFNAQSDDQLIGGSEMLTYSWDNKWYSATKRLRDHWIAEIAIPFKTLRYGADKTLWGINFVRSDLKNNEYSTWTRMPIQFKSWDLGYTGSLIWDAPPPHPGSNSAFIPYVTGGVESNKEDGQSPQLNGNAGFDGKMALSSSMNLDLTVNPDFSQVEVDQQVTNLTRYNIFFPERRTFFLENADLFSSFGIDPIRPFYSRSIGLDPNGNKIPIYAGARLSGNIADRTRIGVMNMQTGKKNGYAAQNYSAVSVSQGVLKRSLVRGYFLNRQASLSDAERKADPLKSYGRNAGVDLGYASLDGSWNVWAAEHRSFKEAVKTDNAYTDLGFGYSSNNFSFLTDYTNLGTNYYTDLGYVERISNYDALLDTSFRVGFKHWFTLATLRIVPKKGKINRHTFEGTNYQVWNPDFSYNERYSEMRYELEWANTAGLQVRLNNNNVHLAYPTSFTDATPLPKGIYNYSQVNVEYSSDIRKSFLFKMGLGGGGFYNGKGTQASAGITYRYQPLMNLQLNVEYTRLNFPTGYGSTTLFLIAPRVEFNFSTNLFWTTFLQYNTQRNNFNINSRLQWRYKPMSDLFVVYTDNYFTDPLLKNKNRALVVKMNFWLNY